jgi:AbrB family looped-hinge helix DNA binding protein
VGRWEQALAWAVYRVWYIVYMAHKSAQAHMQYAVQLGSRGRLVLPAVVRRQLGLHAGDRLVVILDESGEARLVSARKQVEKYCGILAHRARGRMLSEELIAERRAEARRDNEA